MSCFPPIPSSAWYLEPHAWAPLFQIHQGTKLPHNEAPALHHAHPCCVVLTLPALFPHGPEQRLAHRAGAQHRPVFAKGWRICSSRSQESSQ